MQQARAASYLRGVRQSTAIIPIGIAHGYRPTSPEAFVIVNGRRVPVLRACLENTIVDVSDVPDCEGAAVLLLGQSGDLHISVADLADGEARVPAMLVTSLARSIERRHVTSIAI